MYGLGHFAVLFLCANAILLKITCAQNVFLDKFAKLCV